MSKLLFRHFHKKYNKYISSRYISYNIFNRYINPMFRATAKNIIVSTLAVIAIVFAIGNAICGTYRYSMVYLVSDIIFYSLYLSIEYAMIYRKINNFFKNDVKNIKGIDSTHDLLMLSFDRKILLNLRTNESVDIMLQELSDAHYCTKKEAAIHYVKSPYELKDVCDLYTLNNQDIQPVLRNGCLYYVYGQDYDYFYDINDIYKSYVVNLL